MSDINKSHPDMVKRLVKPGQDILKTLTPEKASLWHVASCVPGEGGELFDAVKKFVIYNKELDRDNAIEELGDLEFYLEAVRQELGVTREQTLQANQTKLLTGKKARYASGEYSDKAAQERVDKQ